MRQFASVGSNDNVLPFYLGAAAYMAACRKALLLWSLGDCLFHQSINNDTEMFR